MSTKYDDAEKAFAAFGFVWFILIIVVGFVSVYKGCTGGFNKPPVEEKIDIDSIAKLNDSIKIKINSLDSVKDAKIIEVVTLDNDSSIKLFYELVSE